MTESTTEVPQESALSEFARVSGRVLAVSYPVLALSTGVRAIFQLFFKEGVTELLPPLLSGLAALLYLLATVGFLVRVKPEMLGKIQNRSEQRR